MVALHGVTATCTWNNTSGTFSIANGDHRIHVHCVRVCMCSTVPVMLIPPFLTGVHEGDSLETWDFRESLQKQMPTQMNKKLKKNIHTHTLERSSYGR